MYELIGTFKAGPDVVKAIKQHAKGKSYKLVHNCRFNEDGIPLYDLSVWRD